ncbi:guanine nucleotide-binding protein subunit alpha homolog [Culicoides brevitarsis]|uniref:guanine nucleotide-binding protein subunit alpha homolog n=1 Tax=Culicoides brevitarsis TaxID=469753 RepID=UPI00307C143D
MSACCSNVVNLLFWRPGRSQEEVEQKAKSRQIDKLLEKEKHLFKRQVKLLLLGAGESGKSTFLKQMRIIHGVKFEPELLREYQQIIYQNVIRGLQVLIDAREKLNIAWEDPAVTPEYATEVMQIGTSEKISPDTFNQYCAAISLVWRDGAIRKAYDRRREFQISDSVSYFLDDIHRVANVDFAPTNKDVLMCRKATKGVLEFTIKIQNIPFIFVDVGGQRTQRQKWTNLFNNSVTSILFLVSTSEFDQVLAEDRKTNRLEESRNIFDTIINNQSFQGISIILFLNKTDLLALKVKNPETDIRWYYPQFTGNPHSLLDVQNFILQMFMNVRKNTKTPIYHHFTNAVDTQNIQVVFSSVKDTIFHRNLSGLMLL